MSRNVRPECGSVIYDILNDACSFKVHEYRSRDEWNVCLKLRKFIMFDCVDTYRPYIAVYYFSVSTEEFARQGQHVFERKTFEQN